MALPTAPGWLSAKHPLHPFLSPRMKSLGTELQAWFQKMVRTAPGWLSVRPSGNTFISPPVTLGTAPLATNRSEPCTAPGWLSVQGLNSPHFPKQSIALGTARQIAIYPDACAAPGWLSAQAPVNFSVKNEDASFYHLPVFPEEVVDWMKPTEGNWIIDGTLGGGGHSELFLRAGARVTGVDRDPEALNFASARLAAYGENFSTWEGNFSEIADSALLTDGSRADGLLLDLGVSSRQLDLASRGFSFQREGPLDMRMSPKQSVTAADVVNHWSEAELTSILFEYGEESRARKIAAAIVKARHSKPFTTTLELADCVERTTGRHGRTHPATKTFQAIRMAVNDELASLREVLDAVPRILKPGGRLLIITFHSLEDRMVKRFLKHRTTALLDEPGWPEPRPNPQYQFQWLARKAIAPTPQEIKMNPRARSAKLRVAQLLDLAS